MQRSDVASGLLDDKVVKAVDVEVRVKVRFGQRDDPDARELGQRLAVVEEVVLEPQEAVANTPEQ